MGVPLVVATGGVITDEVRRLAREGDGRAYPDGSAGIWASTTNQVANGGFENGVAGWSGSGGGVLTQSAAQHKFGNYSMNVQTGVNLYGGCESPLVAVNAGETWSWSAWVYRTEDAVPISMAIFNQAGTSRAGITVPTVAGWNYVQKAFLVPGGDTGWKVKIIKSNNATDIAFYVDGVQSELSPMATPYVETSGVAHSRAEGRAQLPSSLLTEAQGWVAMRVRQGWSSAAAPSAPMIYMDWADSPVTRVVIRVDFTPANFEVVTKTNAISVAHPTAIGNLVTLVGRWDASNVYESFNGAAFVGAARGAYGGTAPASAFHVGGWAGGAGYNMSSAVLWLACGTGTLTDADAAALHAIGNGAPPPSTVPAGAALTAIWYANDMAYFAPPERPPAYQALHGWFNG